MRRYYYGKPIAWGPLVLIAALITAVVGIDCAMKPYVSSIVSYEAKNFAVATVDTAVQDELKTKNIDYNDFVTVSRDADGKVQSISSNVEKQNTLQVELTQAVQNVVQKKMCTSVGIPMGTLSGSPILHGRGPCVPLKVTFSGSVQAKLQSFFDSAGINQTRHRLILHVTVGLYTYLIGKDANQQITVDVPVAETVIVGPVPSVALQQAVKAG
ncbi:MAG: sporulation protein YunB [Oscillospiraceae bacterium]|nr:sporulation protein YunB [Oscillospiraceae bacterium]